MASADEMADRMCLMRVLARRAPGRGGAALMEIGTSQGAA